MVYIKLLDPSGKIECIGNLSSIPKNVLYLESEDVIPLLKFVHVKSGDYKRCFGFGFIFAFID